MWGNGKNRTVLELLNWTYPEITAVSAELDLPFYHADQGCTDQNQWVLGSSSLQIPAADAVEEYSIVIMRFRSQNQQWTQCLFGHYATRKSNQKCFRQSKIQAKPKLELVGFGKPSILTSKYSHIYRTEVVILKSMLDCPADFNLRYFQGARKLSKVGIEVRWTIQILRHWNSLRQWRNF